MYFDERALGNKSTKDKSVIRLPKPSALIAGSTKESKTRWSSSAANELYDRIPLLLQEKQAGNNSNIIDEKIFAIADKLLEYK